MKHPIPVCRLKEMIVRFVFGKLGLLVSKHYELIDTGTLRNI